MQQLLPLLKLAAAQAETPLQPEPKTSPSSDGAVAGISTSKGSSGMQEFGIPPALPNIPMRQSPLVASDLFALGRLFALC